MAAGCTILTLLVVGAWSASLSQPAEKIIQMTHTEPATINETTST